MNKFTLRYTDSKLETLYQADQMRTKYQVCMVMSGIITIFFTQTIIYRIVEGQQLDSMPLVCGMFVYAALSLIVVQFKQVWAEASLCILCVVILLMQLDTKIMPESQLIFLLAHNLATLHCVIMFTVDFRYAIVTNVLITVFRLYITSIVTIPAPRGFVFSILTFISLTAGIYWKNSNSRIQYLLKLKDQKWQYLLPKLVDSTFYTFVFNDEQLKFELLTGSNNSQEEFLQFIRVSKIGHQTLENYIFTRFKQFQLLERIETLDNCTQLQVRYNGHSLLLKYYEYFVIQPNFMIVFENHEVEEVKHHYKSVNKVQLRSFNGFVSQIMAMRKNSKSNAESTLRNMYLIMFQFQCRLWLVAGKIVTQPIKFKTLINRCLSMVPNGKVQIQLKEDFTIVTIKPLFVLMMIELLNTMNDQHIQITIKPNQEYIQINFNGQLMRQQLQNNELFNYCINGESIVKQTWYTYIYYLGFMFTIPLVLDISYLNKSRMNI